MNASEPPCESEQTPLRRTARGLSRALPFALLLLCFGGICVRLTVRDRLPVLDMLYYGTPPAAGAILALLAGACWLGRRKPRRTMACGVLAFCLFVWWHATTHVRGGEAVPEGGVRILFWNVADGDMGWSHIARTIRSMDADVVGLVEADADERDPVELWRREFPGYSAAGPRHDMALLCRGEIRQDCFRSPAPGIDVGLFEVNAAGRGLRIVLVDIASSLVVRRQAPLAALGGLLESQPIDGLVVMGDFNTPPDSVLFQDGRLVGFALRDRLVNAFEEAGRGYHVTWPVPVPLIATDQVWLSPDLRPERCRLVSTWLSDHRAVVVDLPAGERPGPTKDEPSEERQAWTHR